MIIFANGINKNTKKKMSKQASPTPMNREDLFREMAKKGTVCESQSCPKREHCLRSILKDYVPEQYLVATVVNLRNPKMQSKDCPQYCPDEPVRMPLGLTHMYDDIPSRQARAIKQHLIALFSRKRYYEYHSAKRPIPPAIEATIRQTLLTFDWKQEPTFDDYVEEYLW